MSRRHDGLNLFSMSFFAISAAIVVKRKPKVVSAFSALSAVIVVTVGVVGLGSQEKYPTAIPQTKFVSGQDIQPYFEGWIKNADGSFDMVFGYMNRNWQEELAIAAGPDNTIDPGGPDRGQPTYFLPRRQGWV
jgi:hypothetical protein